MSIQQHLPPQPDRAGAVFFLRLLCLRCSRLTLPRLWTSLGLPMKALALVIILFALRGADGARSHDARTGWHYPRICCSGEHCEEVPAATVQWTRAGWYVVNTGETIPEKYARPSPDGKFHRCRIEPADRNSRTRCLFVPGLGF